MPFLCQRESTVPIFIQDPCSPSSRNLLAELETHFKGADLICCAFAFATARGVGLLFDSPDVKKRLKKTKTEIIIGMDAITDKKAIERLSVLCSEFESLSVRAFLPSSSGIFHPKISWIKKGDVGVVITGSGNLTKGGLENNFEAFSVMAMNQEELELVQNNWLAFLNSNAQNLFTLESPEVKKAAEENAKIKKAIKKVRKEVGRKSLIDDIPEDDEIIFIEELTKGRGDKQRDVGKWAANNYFENGKTLYFTHVDSRGRHDVEEIRTLSIKGSTNFAIDLDASKGLLPKNGVLPIAVFVRICPQKYVYHVLPADSRDYKKVSDFLASAVGRIPKNNARRLKKAITPAELLEFWPNAPFWS